jgi:hypothetical protein
MADEATTRPARSRQSGPAHEVAVDRLIEMASEEKPAENLPVLVPKDTDRSSMWKLLQQLRSVLPYLSRLLPLLDARLLPLLELVGVGHAQNAGLSKQVHEQLGAVHSGQQELRLVLQDQALEVKQLEEQVARLRDTAEKNELAQARLAQDVKSLRSLIQVAAAALAILTVILIVMAGVLLARSSH